MKKMAKSFMSFFLAAWILFGSLGISWTEATCVYTGAKKITLTKAESCCENSPQAQLSRAKCCILDKYQVKFNFDLTKGNSGLVFAFQPFSAFPSFLALRLTNQHPDFLTIHSNAPPLPQLTRLAQLQTYLI
jgi:hypothetical protein